MTVISFDQIHAEVRKHYAAEARPTLTPMGRVVVLLREVERILPSLTDTQRMDAYDQLDRLGDLCSKADPRTA